MRRSILVLTGVLLSVVALGSDSPKEYDDRTEAIGIDGTWRMVTSEKNVMTCYSGTWTMNDGGGEPWRGTYRIGPAHKPCQLDRYYANGPYGGKAYKFIYQIDGETLRIGGMIDFNDRQRPQDFNDKGVSVWIYKRVK
jgi:uncharacterized protein (TIGR03067 family)